MPIRLAQVHRILQGSYMSTFLHESLLQLSASTQAAIFNTLSKATIYQLE